MSQTLRLGIVGAGGIVKHRHLPGFRAVDGVDLVAVCNRTLESGRAVAKEWQIPEVMDDWRALVARDDLDLVVIGTWPYLHRDITTAALMNHKHVFCQARMTMNYADARHMYELSALSDRVTAICPPPHVRPVDKLVRKLLDEGAIGDLRLVRLSALGGSGADPGQPASWRQIAAYSGLNTMAAGIWFEILRRWCGDCVAVQADSRTWVSERPNPAGGSYQVSIPDALNVLCSYENGAQGALQFSAVAHHGGPERVELYGSAGTLLHEVGSGGVMVGQAGERELTFQAVPTELENPWTVEQNFIAAIRDGVPVETSFYDGLKYMELLEAAHRSSQLGGVVRLPLAP